MKFGQLIEYPTRNIFLKDIMQKMRRGNKFQSTFFQFFKKVLHQVKLSGLQLDFTKFRQASNQHAIETNYLKFYTTDLEIYSDLIFQIRVWEQFLQYILCMIFQQKCSSSYILLTDQISLSDCHFYFLRCWSICALQLFVTQVVIS